MGLELLMKADGFDCELCKFSDGGTAAHLFCGVNDSVGCSSDAADTTNTDMVVLKTDCGEEDKQIESSYAQRPHIRLVKPGDMIGEPHLWKPKAVVETEGKSAQDIRKSLAEYNIRVPERNPPSGNQGGHPEL